MSIIKLLTSSVGRKVLMAITGLLLAFFMAFHLFGNLFLFVGEEILNLIGIDINSFAVAGAIVIFFIALEMVLGVTMFQGEEPETASIVPIAFPIIAGAGTLTTLLSLRAEYHLVNIILAIMINSLFVYIILKSANRIERILGKNGIGIIKKVFGIILLSISVKLFSSNISLIL